MIKNLKELRQLIKRYKSITLDEVNEVVNKYSKLNFIKIAEKVTGFSSFDCLICKSVNGKCNHCVMGQNEDIGCIDNNYNKIRQVSSSKELVKFYHKRATYLEMKYKYLLC